MRADIEVSDCDVEFEWWINEDTGARSLCISFHDEHLNTQVQVTVKNPGVMILGDLEVPPSVSVYEEGKRVG